MPRSAGGHAIFSATDQLTIGRWYVRRNAFNGTSIHTIVQLGGRVASETFVVETLLEMYNECAT